MLDDFLTHDWASGLLHLFEGTIPWKKTYGLYRRGEHARKPQATEEEWLAAEPEQRFWRHYQPQNPREIGSLAEAQARLFLFRHRILGDPALLARLGQWFGKNLMDTHVVLFPVAMQKGDFQGLHSDADRTRALCGALYLSHGWQSGFGGEFDMVAGERGLYRIAPLHNRIVLFDPHEMARPPLSGRVLHQIRSLMPEAGAWQRFSVTAWWTRPS